ncbi:olfactory receptor 8I2-like [Rhea pennata]|uniref:olfactory receptor 8I2-like n=1 Tax=Rhea pennata TaxID=8795 RepID=UPI002E25BA20
MDGENLTVMPDFILLGFTNFPELESTMFTVFLILYILTVMGNLAMILLINIDSQLHTPMYFFLSHLSFMDFCLSSDVIPKALEIFLFRRNDISFMGCFVQMYFFLALIACECFLLGIMAYDRYMALCKPLLYTVIMSKARCYRMTASIYAVGFLISLINTMLAGRLSFCQVRGINHFFCELPSLLQLSCSNTHTNELLQFTSTALNVVGSVLMILVSYTYILYTIMWIPSAEGRLKAFSTCASHLAAVMLFYGPGLFSYFQPQTTYSQDRAKVISIFYTLLTPTLNPLIYSLRNKEVKGALRRLLA